MGGANETLLLYNCWLQVGEGSESVSVDDDFEAGSAAVHVCVKLEERESLPSLAIKMAERWCRVGDRMAKQITRRGCGCEYDETLLRTAILEGTELFPVMDGRVERVANNGDPSPYQDL